LILQPLIPYTTLSAPKKLPISCSTNRHWCHLAKTLEIHLLIYVSSS